MSNLPLVPRNVIEHLGWKTSLLKVPVHFGAVSHDGTVTVTEIATSSNPFLPPFYVAPTGYMSILPTSYLSKMGYEIVILSNELGFLIQNNNGDVIYRGSQQKNKFHYLPWDFLLSLKPANEDICYQINDTDYIIDVILELDALEIREGGSCNSVTKNNSIPAENIRYVRDEHSRMGHMSPKKMSQVVANGLRSDMPPYSADQLAKIMQRWPCLYCTGASARVNPENIGSGVHTSKPFTRWYVDNKDGYTPCLYFGYTGYYVFKDDTTGYLYVFGHKNHDGAHLQKSSTITSYIV